MKRIKFTILTTFFAVTAFCAQQIPPPPPFEDDGGLGTSGTGAYPNSIIDQFLYVLMVVGVLGVFYVQYRKTTRQKKKRYTTTSRQIKKRLEHRSSTAELNKA